VSAARHLNPTAPAVDGIGGVLSVTPEMPPRAEVVPPTSAPLFLPPACSGCGLSIANDSPTGPRVCRTPWCDFFTGTPPESSDR